MSPDGTTDQSTELERVEHTELDRFPDPGLPEHVYRMTDVDKKAAKRAERQVAALFGLSALGAITFVVGYFAISLDSVNDVAWSNLVLGGGLGISLFCIGAGAIHWAKKLMPDDEIAEDRKPLRSSDEDRAGAAAVLAEGGEGAGFPRRKLIWGSLTGALAALALPAIVPLLDLGPLPGAALSHTTWRKGTKLVTDPQGRPIKASELTIGSVVHVLPEGAESLEDRAQDAVILIRLAPGEYTEPADRKGWSYNGIVAYSKVCTHVGCPVGLYEHETHHLLCPCHQSTFDVSNSCAVIFGPAARPLPQLAITVDADGFLVAQHDFTEPVGPSFWERG
jgi:ubiquinol-cytochrome c reductase iron-sulfur subunit